jgi:polyhydroxybutyrate depolymerase
MNTNHKKFVLPRNDRRSGRIGPGAGLIAFTCLAAFGISSNDVIAEAASTTRLPVAKNLTIKVGDLTRTYDLATSTHTATPTSSVVKPSKSKKTKNKKSTTVTTSPKNLLRPLVLVFHGNGGSADQVLDQTDQYGSPLGQWLAIAARENLVIAAPNGTLGSDGKQSWNDCRADATSNAKSDDVAFVGALIDELVRTQQIDPARVYAVGMSNGGHMVFRLALEAGDRFAAFGPVSASLAAKSSCKDTGIAKPIVMINGNADPFWPFTGGPANGKAGAVGATRGSILSNADTIAEMVRRNKANTVATSTSYPDIDPNDGTTAQLRQFPSPSTPVWAITIEGGGHTEPSLVRIYPPNYERLVGRQNHDIETAEEQWRLFKTTTR